VSSHTSIFKNIFSTKYSTYIAFYF